MDNDIRRGDIKEIDKLKYYLEEIINPKNIIVLPYATIQWNNPITETDKNVFPIPVISVDIISK